MPDPDIIVPFDMLWDCLPVVLLPSGTSWPRDVAELSLRAPTAPLVIRVIRPPGPSPSFVSWWLMWQCTKETPAVPSVAAGSLANSCRGGRDRQRGADALGPTRHRDAMTLSRATVRKMKQNLAWASVYNFLAVPIAAGALFPSTGIELRPEWSALLMSFSSIVVATNAVLLKVGHELPEPARPQRM
jgi:hypothetical protein